MAFPDKVLIAGEVGSSKVITDSRNDSFGLELVVPRPVGVGTEVTKATRAELVRTLDLQPERLARGVALMLYMCRCLSKVQCVS